MSRAIDDLRILRIDFLFFLVFFSSFPLSSSRRPMGVLPRCAFPPSFVCGCTAVFIGACRSVRLLSDVLCCACRHPDLCCAVLSAIAPYTCSALQSCASLLLCCSPRSCALRLRLCTSRFALPRHLARIDTDQSLCCAAMQEVPRKNKPSYPVPAGKPIVPTPGMKLLRI